MPRLVLWAAAEASSKFKEGWAGHGRAGHGPELGSGLLALRDALDPKRACCGVGLVAGIMALNKLRAR